MGLFSKPNYKSVVEFLAALSDQEYKKLSKVVNIYRNAGKNVEEVLGSPLDGYRLEYEEVGELPKKVAKKATKGGR